MKFSTLSLFSLIEGVEVVFNEEGGTKFGDREEDTR
jgi:hypothetical protein